MVYVEFRLGQSVLKTFILTIILNFWFCKCSAQSVSQLDMVRDVKVHQGYKIKYSFKDRRYLDLEILPNPNLNYWLAVTLEKSLPGSNRMLLQTYKDEDLKVVKEPNSYLDIGNCQQIRSFSQNDTIFLLASKCDNNTHKVEVVVVDPLTPSLTRIQTLSHSSIEDAAFWSNIYTNDLNLIVLTRAKHRLNGPSTIFHYIFDSDNLKFTKFNTIKTVESRSLTVFDIEDRTYIAVSKYRDSSGKFVDSSIFIQDLKEGKLIKHQEIKSKGTISLTYFCFIGLSKTEHFLLAANNKILKGAPGSETLNTHIFEESILFKWEDGYFMPFQTLFVRVPSPWIIVPGGHDNLVLLTWSYVDGIVSYQYDGWRFRRTAQQQKDILNQDSPTFALLKRVSIGGEILFTIFTNKIGAKRKYFFVPIFKENTKSRANYEKQIEWCNSTLIELKLAWDQFRPHSEYLSQLSENANKSPEDKVLSFFDLVLGYNSRKRKENTGLEIMSQQGIPTYDTSSIRSSSQEPQQCTLTDVKISELSKVSQIIHLEDGIIALKEPNVILFYPVIDGIGLDSSKGVTLHHLKVKKVTGFQSVKLCHHQGIYIEGMINNTLFGRVYKIQNDNTLSHQLSLKIHQESTVSGYCVKRLGDCFIVNPVSGNGNCAIYCNNVIKRYNCSGKHQEEAFHWNDHTTIGINADKTIYKTTVKAKNKYETTELKQANKTSKILRGVSGHDFYISIIDPEEIQLCKLIENKLNEEDPIVCSKFDSRPTLNSTTVKIGSVQNEICLFIGSNNSINMYMLSKNYVMVLNLEDKLKDKVFDPFTIKRSNFISFKTEGKTIIIEYTLCKPK